MAVLKSWISLFPTLKENDFLQFPWYPCVWCLLLILHCSMSPFYVFQIGFILLLKYSWRKFTLKRVFALRRGSITLQKPDSDPHRPTPRTVGFRLLGSLGGLPTWLHPEVTFVQGTHTAGSSHSHWLLLESIFVFHSFSLQRNNMLGIQIANNNTRMSLLKTIMDNSSPKIFWLFFSVLCGFWSQNRGSSGLQAPSGVLSSYLLPSDTWGFSTKSRPEPCSLSL